MDAAWGSKDGDESTTAQVTNNTASVGYVFEQIYKPWNGTLNPRWMRNWAILRHHVLGIFRKGHRPWSLPTKLFIVVVFIASLADVGLTLLAALIGSPELHTMWGVNRDNLWACSWILPPKHAILSYSSSFTCWRGNFRGQISWDICVILFSTSQ